jgi:hypothetical protein
MIPKRPAPLAYGRYIWLSTLSLWVIFLVGWVSLSPVEAAPVVQTPTIQVLQNTARVDYRTGVEFRVLALLSNGSEATKATLKIKYGTHGREENYNVELTKGTGSYTLSEDENDLATGMPLIYSWTLGTDKVQTQTAPQTVIYEDTNYKWYQHEGPKVTVRWYNGDTAYGDLMYQLASDSLGTYKRRFNIDPTDQIYITIYGNSKAYYSTFPEVPSWSGGFSRYGGVEIVAIAPQDYNASIYIGEGIPHELSHAAVYQFLRAPAPRWMDEGFAVYNQNTIAIKEYDELVQRAYQNNVLIPLSKLNSRWPSDVDASKLAYAEGRSIVTFLINTYGNEVWSNLLDQLRRNDIDEAMKAVFGIDLAQMEELWKAKALGGSGSKVTMPPALLKGPVPSQISDADLKARAARQQPPKQDSGLGFWLILLLALVGTFLVVALTALLVVNRRKKAGLSIPNWWPGGRDSDDNGEHDKYVIDYMSNYNRFYTDPPASSPSVFPPVVPQIPSVSVPPPIGGVLPMSAPWSSNEASQPALWPGFTPTESTSQATVDDPFDLIMLNFGTNATPPPTPGPIPRPFDGRDASLHESDPYGLKLGNNESDKKNF